MRQVLETQLIDHCFRPFGDDATKLLDSLTDSEVEALREALGTFLIEQSKDGDSGAVTTSALEVPASRDFKSILYKDSGSRGTKKIVAFSFRDAAVDTVLPILGIAISTFSGSLGVGAITTVLGGLKTLWSKVVVLKAPADADAIAVLEAILRIRARSVATRENRFPTNADIQRELSAQPIPLKPSLSRLKTLKVIEAVSWGGQAEDLEHAANSWKVRL